MSETERMELVRSLQNTFYRSSSSSSIADDDDDIGREQEAPHFSPKDGILSNLPLWRVGWVEVPGRSNILNVHEGHYTHMFETILRRGDDDEPKYFGHLYSPGGTKSSRTGERRFALKSWRDEVADPERWNDSGQQRSAVLGCLMRITDYRRLEDGRLILHVQALERFVVEQAMQEFPYAVAHVQILPDVEQLGELVQTNDENFAHLARGTAAKRALQYYHPYEFAKTKLPLPTDEFMAADAVAGVAMAKLLPFAEYNINMTLDVTGATDDTDSTKNETTTIDGFSGRTPLLESELERLLVFHGSSVETYADADADAEGLEKLIWLALEELTRHTGFVLPKEIKRLLPPQMDYLDFSERSTHLNESNSQPLSLQYPKTRRQARLSFTVPAIWEKPDQATAIRQGLLQIPSTTARLAAVLHELKNINRKYDDSIGSSSGEFE